MSEINEFYDFEYSPSKCVSNASSYFEQWLKDSAEARAALVNYKRNLSYGEGEREIIDLFFAENSTKWLVFIHGGYWQAFTKEHFSYIAPPLVKSGYNVAVVEYHLCPEVTIPIIIEQCRKAIAWLYRHTLDYGKTCEEMVISGHSAGGYLTAMMFATEWEKYNMPVEIIKGGIAISGLFDLEPLVQTNINNPLHLNNESAHAISPIYFKPTIHAPMVLAVGALESSEFHRQSRLIFEHEAWQAIAQELISIENTHHFDVVDLVSDTTGVMWAGLQKN
jgi:arylformamidase